MRQKKLLPVKGYYPFIFLFFFFLFSFIPVLIDSAPLFSPTWGFSIDLPGDYEYVDGDGRDRFTFRSSDEATFTLVVYGGSYSSVETLVEDVRVRLGNSGDIGYFDYRNKKAAFFELDFILPNGFEMTGWGLAVELNAGEPELLLALAYGPAWREDLQIQHLSVLDSIAPTREDWRFPGPVTEFTYPREHRIARPLWDLGVEAWFFTEDEEAAQDLIDREFGVLRRYADSPLWREAWIRFYNAIYRDSYDRLANAAFIVERTLNVPPLQDRDFAGQVLDWIQSFYYERDFGGSDFTNLVSAIIDGRGDCDSRAMLWAIILNQANIPAAIMVSREYSHAMALADLPGLGARFEAGEKSWLVAETTSQVPIGLIAADMSDPEHWIGIIFPY